LNVLRDFRSAVALLVLAVASCSSAPAAQEFGGKVKNLKPLSLARSPRELAVRLNKLLSSSSTIELNRLVAEPDTTVALAAGWERVSRTLPASRQEEPLAPDDQAISRFLGLLEGRIQIPVPAAWEAAVKSVKAHRQGEVRFSRVKEAGQPFPDGAFLRRAGERWIVKKDGHLIKLPANDGLGPVDFAAVEIAPERAYTALFGWPPVPYELSATDRGSGEIVWSTRVWATGDWLSYSGTGWHFVAIRSARESVAVFGISFDSVYVEVFDKNTGKNSCRFSTANFDTNSPRK
jgi:hypothetical protein